MRAPSVCKRVPITSETMQVENLWGGLIYLLAPANTQVTGVEVIVQQAVLAPYYKSGESVVGKTVFYSLTRSCLSVLTVLSGFWTEETSCVKNTHNFKLVLNVAIRFLPSGVTTACDWSLLRAAPSPWAELEFDNIILSVPSNIVRDLERPDELAALWNDIMKAVADLAVIPRNFPRKERIVTDVQISAGNCIWV